MNDPDGINEALGNAVTKAITVGTEVARALAQLMERRAQQAQRLQEEAYKRYVQDARSVLRDVSSSRWWDKATPDEIGRAWEMAQATRGIEDLDADARKAESRIHRELGERYGIDPENPGVDPASLGDLVAQRIDEVQRARPQVNESERPPVEMTEKQQWHIEGVFAFDSVKEPEKPGEESEKPGEEKKPVGHEWWGNTKSHQRLRAWNIAQDFPDNERAVQASQRIMELAEWKGKERITSVPRQERPKAVKAYLEELVRADPAITDFQRASVLAKRNFAKKPRAAVARQPAAGARQPAHSRGRPPAKGPSKKRPLRTGEAATIG